MVAIGFLNVPSVEGQPVKEWSRTFGGGDNDIASSLIQTSDGGYALAGGTGSYGAGAVDFWLVKTDSQGEKEWSRTFGGSDRYGANSVVQTSDGGYALAGGIMSYGARKQDFWLVKLGPYRAGEEESTETSGGEGLPFAWIATGITIAAVAIIGFLIGKSRGVEESDAFHPLSESQCHYVLLN